MNPSTNIPTIKDIENAYQDIKGDICHTPCLLSRTLSAMTGAELYLKFENLQFTASFKERGALNKLLSLTDEQRKTGVVTMSAGNHAQAVAYHAQRLGIPAVIVMPRYTPTVKVEHTRAFGAEVILRGENFDEAALYVQQVIKERKLVLVHPYDDPLVIAGQGTIALEMLESNPDLEILVFPIGGGGLVAGNAIAAKTLKPDIQIIGVETMRFPSMKQAVQGQDVEYGPFSLADGIAVKQPGALTRAIVSELVDDILLVDEPEIEHAVLALLEIEKTVVEGAGAVGLSAILQYPGLFTGKKVGVVLSGGNIDLPVLSTIIERGLVNSGRVARITASVRDIPGKLTELTRMIEESGANIIHLHQHRAFTHLPVQMVQLELTLQTRGVDHLKEIESLLQQAGILINESTENP
jgi:threonine dehydratase